MRRLGKWLGRIILLVLVALGLFLVFGPGYVETSRNAVAEHEPYPVSEEAAALHGTLTIGDWHADSLLWDRDLLERGDRGHVDLPRLQEGNVARRPELRRERG